jgi:chaperonin GroES
MAKKIRPIGQNILVKPSEAETTTKSGVVIVEKEESKPESGKVIALGNGVRMPDGTVSAFTVKVGDEVKFRKYAGTELEVDDENYLIMSEADVLCVIE